MDNEIMAILFVDVWNVYEIATKSDLKWKMFAICSLIVILIK